MELRTTFSPCPRFAANDNFVSEHAHIQVRGQNNCKLAFLRMLILRSEVTCRKYSEMRSFYGTVRIVTALLVFTPCFAS